MPAVFKSSSNVSFSMPANLLVRKSVTTKDRVLGSTASTSSGIGMISLSLKYCVYISTLSLSQSLGDFFATTRFAMTRRLALQVLSWLARQSWLYAMKPMKMINLPASLRERLSGHQKCPVVNLKLAPPQLFTAIRRSGVRMLLKTRCKSDFRIKI